MGSIGERIKTVVLSCFPACHPERSEVTSTSRVSLRLRHRRVLACGCFLNLRNLRNLWILFFRQMTPPPGCRNTISFRPEGCYDFPRRGVDAERLARHGDAQASPQEGRLQAPHAPDSRKL